jgi:hypothetical protein
MVISELSSNYAEREREIKSIKQGQRELARKKLPKNDYINLETVPMPETCKFTGCWIS